MSEKAQDDEFEEEDDDNEDVVEDDDGVDIDHLFSDLDKRKRAGTKVGDPAWRRLEKYREEQHTAELVSDFDDYDIGDNSDEGDGRSSRQHHRRAG